MIYLKLSGGLGNQMFQYAFGRSMSIRTGEELYLDISEFGKVATETKRNFELDIFSVPVNLANETIAKRYKSNITYKRWLSRFVINVNGYVYERNRLFKESYLRQKGDIYLDGYWQNYLFFKDNEEIIRQDFVFKKELTTATKKVIEEVQNCESVGVHLRRTDYVNNRIVNQVLVPCSLDYYRSAFDYMNSNLTNPVYYIFSDDIEWVKENFKAGGKMRYIDINKGKNNWMDMAIMSNCKHNIIANSSFSWWGAFLNKNKEKIVICPRQWFATGETVKGLIPDKWIQI